MVENRVLFIIDNKGDYINVGSGSVKALSDLTNTIHLIAPFPLETMIMFSTLAKSDRQYNDTALMFATTLRGSDLSDNPKVKDWNVWQVRLTQKQLSHISRYRVGRIGVSFHISNKHYDLKDGDYKGVFNSMETLPNNATKGDYYIANDYSVKGYQRGDIAQYDGNEWVKVKKGRLLLNTETIELPVLPSLSVNFDGYDMEAEDIINDLNSDINTIIKENEEIKDDIVNLNDNKLDKVDNRTFERQYYGKSEDGIQVMIDESDLKPDLSDYYNKVEVDSKLYQKANRSEIPRKVSQLENDKHYVTAEEVEEGVNLVNYYNKDETDAKLNKKQDERDDIVLNLNTENDTLYWQTTNDVTHSYTIPKIKLMSELENDVGYMKRDEFELFILVKELPTENIRKDVIYLVPNLTRSNNIYTEYIYVNNEWEKLGEMTAKVDLSDYYTKEQTYNKNEVYNKGEIDNKLNTKADLDYVDDSLGQKANLNFVNAELNKKADKNFVNQELEKKADITYVDQKIDEIPKPDMTNYYKKGETYSSAQINDKLSLKADTAYVEEQISNIPKPDLTKYYTKSETYNQKEINDKLNLKQDKLLSGQNIKTINGHSLLGSGDIDITEGIGGSIQIEVDYLGFSANSPSSWFDFLISQGIEIPNDLSKLPLISVYASGKDVLYVLNFSTYEASAYCMDDERINHQYYKALDMYKAIKQGTNFEWKRVATTDDLGDIGKILDDINGV